jgi:4-hydroxy-4-methyl-2-oxoglutarate aldolase
VLVAFEIGNRPPLDPELNTVIERLRVLSTGTLGHFTDFGFAGGLQPLSRPVRAVGRAFTIRIPQTDAAAVHYALGLVEPGEVLVIDTSGERTRATWGGVVTYAAVCAGVAGAIIDGPVTDWEEITSSGLPVWCRGLSALTARLAVLEGAIQVPVQVAGVVVEPGDIAFADSDGAFFIRPRDAAGLMERVAAAEESEIELKRRLDAGEKLPDILDTRARVEPLLRSYELARVGNA